MQITVHCINPKNMAYWQCVKNTMKPMDFERDYLPGVVAGEMGDCSQPEALKAQAIAARSYAYQYILKGAAIYDTSKAQVFEASRAVSKTYLLHRQAAEETAGIVVCYNGKPVTTNYTHSNGGKVKAYGKAWMIAKDDPWDDEPRKGHGAGMSQSGANNMAAAGKTYAEILQFYYPGTTLRAEYGQGAVNEPAETVNEPADSDDMTDDQKIIYFQRDQVGEPYDLGDHGPDKWDCSGLTMESVRQLGYSWEHSSRRQYDNGFKTGDPAKYGYWKASGKISTMPTDEVVFLFNYGLLSNGKEYGMKHVGTYDPVTQNVIQAGGYLGKGVHEDPISAARKHFTHWCTRKPKSWTAEAANVATPTTTAKRATLRKGSTGNLVKELQGLLNQKNGAGLKVDGIFGKITRAAVIAYQEKNGLAADGIVGTKTWAQLLK